MFTAYLKVTEDTIWYNAFFDFSTHSLTLIQQNVFQILGLGFLRVATLNQNIAGFTLDELFERIF